MVLSIKRQAPGDVGQERARVSRDTRVSGASIVLAERGKPETAKTGSEHAARRDLMIL